MNVPDDAGPSVQTNYRSFVPTTTSSVPVPRIGTLALMESIHLSFSLRIGATGSYVPYQCLSHVHATFMPDARWTVIRSPPS